MTGADIQSRPCHYLYAYPVILSALSVILSVSEESDKHFLADNKSIISYTQILHSACGSVQDDKVRTRKLWHLPCAHVKEGMR